MCTDCNEITIPVGPPGIDGENSYTVLTASYVQPAVSTNVTISVSDTGQYSTGWCAVGQIIFVQVGGYYEVVSKTVTSITIKYTAPYTTYNQSLTASGGTVPNSGIVSPGGIIGLTGVAGSNGTNGTTILNTYNSVTGIGTPATLVETTLYSYNVPANTLNNNGDELELYSIINFPSTDTVVMRWKLGAKIVTIGGIGFSAGDIRIIRIKISRISSTSQLWTMEYNVNDLTTPEVNVIVDSSTVDLTTILAFEITAQNTVATANSVVLKKATLYKYSA